MKASILLAIKREQRNRRSNQLSDGLHGKRETKSLSDAVITHVTHVTVEDTPMTKLEEPATEDTRSLREIWDQECDVFISYKTFLQRVKTQKWDLQKALHTPKAR